MANNKHGLAERLLRLISHAINKFGDRVMPGQLDHCQNTHGNFIFFLKCSKRSEAGPLNNELNWYGLRYLICTRMVSGWLLQYIFVNIYHAQRTEVEI